MAGPSALFGIVKVGFISTYAGRARRAVAMDLPGYAGRLFGRRSRAKPVMRREATAASCHASASHLMGTGTP